MRDDKGEQRHPARTDVVSVMWGGKTPSHNSSVNGNAGRSCVATPPKVDQDPHRKDPKHTSALNNLHPQNVPPRQYSGEAPARFKDVI